MVANRHVNGESVKRFKRVHVRHKMYVASNVTKKEEPVAVEIEPVLEVLPAENHEVVEEVVAAAPKAKKSRKKAVADENNEENIEDHE